MAEAYKGDTEDDEFPDEDSNESPYHNISTRLYLVMSTFDNILKSAKDRKCIKNHLVSNIQKIRFCLLLLRIYERLPIESREHNTLRLDICKGDLRVIYINLQACLALNDLLMPRFPKQPLQPARDSSQFSNLISYLYVAKYRTHFAFQHLETWLTYYDCVEEIEIHSAASKGDEAKFVALIGRSSLDSKLGCNGTVVHSVVFGGNTELLDHLCRAGVAIDERDEYENTPLMMAALFGDENMIRHLLKKGASPDLGTMFRHTPLTVEIVRRHRDTIPLLLQHSKRSHVPDTFGMTNHELAKHFHNDLAITLLTI